MAQRREIRCAESQFALQSSRLVEREKFRKAILSRESAYALPLFVFLTGLLTASPEIRTRVFLFECQVAGIEGSSFSLCLCDEPLSCKAQRKDTICKQLH